MKIIPTRSTGTPPSVLHVQSMQEGLRFVEDRVTGQLWFVARDVCDKLGTDAKDIPAILDWDEYRPLASLKGVDSIEGLNKLNGLRKDARMLSEPGLYGLIFCSRKPEAKAFRRWVTHEVLPAISKHGAYFTQPLAERMLDDPDYAIELLQKIKAEREEKEHHTRLNQLFPSDEEYGDGLTIDVTPAQALPAASAVLA